MIFICSNDRELRPQLPIACLLPQILIGGNLIFVMYLGFTNWNTEYLIYLKFQFWNHVNYSFKHSKWKDQLDTRFQALFRNANVLVYFTLYLVCVLRNMCFLFWDTAKVGRFYVNCLDSSNSLLVSKEFSSLKWAID